MKSGTRKEFVRREGRLEGEGTNEASTRCGQLEVLNGEWEVVVIRIVDEETVIDVLLEAFGFVASWDERAGFAGSVSVALFDASVLIKLVAVRLDFVDDHAPLTIDVDGAEGLDVGGCARAQVSLLFEFAQSVDRVGSVDGDVLVQSQDGFVVFVQFVDDFVTGIISILEAPGLGRVLAAFGNLWLVFGFIFGLVIVSLGRGISRRLVARRAAHSGQNAQTQENLYIVFKS